MVRMSPSNVAANEVGDDVTAILGPTNTGKTHRAVERMLEHETGMIGLPLRLLAREVYDRVTARVGEAAVALVTGEEKRVPPHPRYWVCTVEAMPAVAAIPGGIQLLAVDEIQLASHPARGHVFTDRIQHARGAHQTLLLGADTVRPLLARLVPRATIESQARFSALTSAGSLTLGALPPRTAVVAFSAARVYELGERLRARRGGAAIVLGALSPRARNAQVALYQSGEVDYLVATDAIGMGLNMDIDCVAFADLAKFDGRRLRALENAELAQIAGRAGRHRNDGRFATLAPAPPLATDVVRAIEQHRFAPEERLYWRSHALDLETLPALLASLRRRPPAPWLAAADDAEDHQALERLARRAEILARADSPERVSLLWQICQIPDYRQLQLDDHLHLQATLFEQLAQPRGRIAADWIDRHLAPLENLAGDIETLLARMAGIRTWTYVAHQTGWIDDAVHWQERARTAEDRLSDALHERLVQRFVDARARRRARAAKGSERGAHGAQGAATPHPVPARAARPAAAPASFADLLRAHVAASGDQHPYRDLDPAGDPGDGDREDDRWVDALVDARHDRFQLAAGGRIAAGGESLARLIRGVDLLHPEVAIVTTRPLGAGARLRLTRRLLAWTRDLVAALLAPLRATGPALSAATRGILYQLEQGLGTIPAHAAAPQLRALDSESRAALRQLGVRVGRHVVFVPRLLVADAVSARVALCNAQLGPGAPLESPRPGAASLRALPQLPAPSYASIGYPVFGARAIRADLVDGIGARLLGGARVTDIASRLGCRVADVASVRATFLEQSSTAERTRGA
jgi:ATP-dependent RNA helicase SUPV3L1/SUV3